MPAYLMDTTVRNFGANVWIWESPVSTEAVERLVPHVAAVGFDLLEVPIENLGDLDCRRGAEVIHEHGLSVSVAAAIGPDRDLIHPDESIRQNGFEFVKGCVDACSTLGGKNVIGPLYSGVGRTWQATPAERARDIDLLVGILRDLAGYAGDHGITLCLEPLNRFETSFINLAVQAVEVIDRVNHPACQMMLDTFHMNIEEKSFGDAIRCAGTRLRHVHACGSDRGAPGSGNIDWPEVVQALDTIEYDGPIVIESFTAKIETIARAAAIWRPLAESQDALAEQGLQFLRGVFGASHETVNG